MISKEQFLIQKTSCNLPIKVYPEREILAKLREHFEDQSINLKSEFEIHSMSDLKDSGGIVCEIRPKEINEENLETTFLCSITHFKIKKGEHNYQELEKYRIKRIRKLARENKNKYY